MLDKYQHTRYKEKVVICVTLLLCFVYTTWNLTMIVYSYTATNCEYWDPFYKIHEEDWTAQNWRVIINMFEYTFYLLIWVGVTWVFVKISVGVLLLQSLRNHLNAYYNKRKRLAIITTIFASWTIVLWRWFYNILKGIRECDLKYNFAAKKSFPGNEAPLQLLISVCDISLPIVVMLLNIRTINYGEYLVLLIKAWQLEEYTSIASIFIRF